jgi:hypothetical protein
MADAGDVLSDDYQLPKESLYTFDEALTRVGGGFNRYQICCFIYFGFQWMMAKYSFTLTMY